MALRARSFAAFGTLLLATFAIPSVASAEECEGWFCDAPAPTTAPPASTTPAPTSVEPSASPSSSDGAAIGMPATIALPGGQVLDGTVTELVPGDHVTLRTPFGVNVRLSWSLVVSIKIGGASAPSTSAPSTPPARPRPRVYAPPPYATPAPPYTPPPVEETDGAPSSGCSGPGCPMRRRAQYQPRWEIGTRLSVLGVSGDSSLGGGYGALRDYAGSGVGIEGSLGYRLASWVSLYGAYQFAGFGTGAQNSSSGSSVLSHTLLLGLHADTGDHGVGFVADAGIGYRWLQVPLAQVGYAAGYQGYAAYNVASTFEGVTGRVGAGISFGSPRSRWELLAELAMGTFDKQDGQSLGDSSKGSYALAGLSFGGRFGF